MQRSTLLLGAFGLASLCYWGTLSAQTLPYDHMHLAAESRSINNVQAGLVEDGNGVLIDLVQRH